MIKKRWHFLNKIKLFIPLFLGLLILISTPVVVLAISNPDSISIGECTVFRDVEEDGDQLYYCRYEVGYLVEPEEDASNTFLMAIYDTDGTTLLFTRPLNYYQHNIISIYLSAADALTWGESYKIRIMGNPALFSLAEGTNMRTWALSGGDYREFSELGTYLIGQASILEADWGIDLLTSGNLLNTQGSIVFRDAIPGLNNIVPEIFSTTSSYFTVENKSFTENYANAAHDRLGSINQSFADIGEWLGISEGWVGVCVSSLISVLLGSVIFATTRRTEVVYVSMFTTYGVFGTIGWIPLQLFIITFIIIGIIFGILWWIGRMG